MQIWTDSKCSRSRYRAILAGVSLVISRRDEEVPGGARQLIKYIHTGTSIFVHVRGSEDACSKRGVLQKLLGRIDS